MVHLILDTNIWIYLAEGQHPFVLRGIIEKVDSKELILLVNDEVVKEWDRNRGEIKRRIESELKKQINIAKELTSALDSSDADDYKSLVGRISDKKPKFLSTIKDRFDVVDNLIKNKSINVPIKEKHKLTVVEMALDQKAPFHRKKNSVADALILLSSIDYIKNNGLNAVDYNRVDVSDSIFVSYNSDDFSKNIKGPDKEVIHPDLKPLLDSVGMTYERNFGKILNLSSKLKKEIESYVEYIESRIIEQMQWEEEMMRGK